jgi:predicted secreted protein
MVKPCFNPSALASTPGGRSTKSKACPEKRQAFSHVPRRPPNLEFAMKSLKIIRLVIMLAIAAELAATLSGCQSAGAGARVKPEEQAAIVNGKTTKQELLQRLGDPDQISDLGNGKEEMIYLRENVSAHRNWFHPTYSGFWVVLKDNTVEAYGERTTMPDQGYRLWPF